MFQELASRQGEAVWLSGLLSPSLDSRPVAPWVTSDKEQCFPGLSVFICNMGGLGRMIEKPTSRAPGYMAALLKLFSKLANVHEKGGGVVS